RFSRDWSSDVCSSDLYIDTTEPIAYVTEHLKANAGNVHIGVVSGGTRTTVQRTLSVLGLTDYIEVLVCAGETPNGKPFPDPFLRSEERRVGKEGRYQL